MLKSRHFFTKFGIQFLGIFLSIKVGASYYLRSLYDVTFKHTRKGIPQCKQSCWHLRDQDCPKTCSHFPQTDRQSIPLLLLVFMTFCWLCMGFNGRRPSFWFDFWSSSRKDAVECLKSIFCEKHICCSNINKTENSPIFILKPEKIYTPLSFF